MLACGDRATLMTALDTIIRLVQTVPARRALLIEAGWNLVRARVAIRWQPFKAAIAFGAIPLGSRRPVEGKELVEAIVAVAARVPWRSVCFDQALALQRALRRRGRDARLHYGISAPALGPLEAHVWVVLDGCTILGAEQAGCHQPVAIFPAA